MCRIIVNCAVALDLNLIGEFGISNPEDWKRVDILRSEMDAIIVGGETARIDTPNLTIKDAALIEERVLQGLPPQLTRIVITERGDFTERFLNEILGIRTLVIGIGQKVQIITPYKVDTLVIPSMKHLKQTFDQEGLKNILVEGGATLINSLLEEDLVDELHLAVAPFVDEGEKLKLLYPEIKREKFCFSQTALCGDMAIITLKRR